MKIVTLLAALLLALPALAGPPEITLTRTENGLIADYRFDQEVTAMEFERAADVERLNFYNPGNWALLTAGMRLKNGAVSMTDGAPFRSFSIHLVPTVNVSMDRTYPALLRLGAKAYLLYAPYLAKGDGYVYVGPDIKGDRSVIAPGIPAQLRREVERDLKAALGLFQRRLGTSLAGKPTIVISWFPGEKSGFHGDTSPGWMMSLRFFGKEWAHPSAKQREEIARFVFHEAFHYWNSGIVHASPLAPTWLHEGSADYAAWLAERLTGRLDEAQFDSRLRDAVAQCNRLLAGASLDSPAAQKGYAPYACGAALQGRTKDFFAVWKTILAEARQRPDLSYDAADFQRAAGLPDLDPVLQ